MKKNTISRKALSLLFALVLCMSLAVPAFAVDTPYTPVAGGTTSFDKVLIMDSLANVPTIDFAFSIAPGTAVSYDVNGQVFAVYAGDDAAVSGTPTLSGNGGANTVSFAPGHATATSGTSATIDSGEKAAVEAVTVDFSSVTFAEPGIYRWVITETSAGQQGVTYDTQAGTPGMKTRVLDVFVVDNNGALQVSSYVLHEDPDSVDMGDDFGSDYDPATLADKSAGFVNEYTTYDITVSKAVSGNQASKDKYFQFEVAIANAGANVALDVDWTGAVDAQNAVASAATVYTAATMQAANQADDSADSAAVAATEWYVNGDTTSPYASQAEAEAAAGALEPAGVVTDNGVAGSSGLAGNQWVTDANGAVTKTVYLKHGQSIVIKGLGAGATYTVTEVPEDYEPSYSLDGAASADGAVANHSTALAADSSAAFTNTRSGAIPTGVMMSVAGGAALVAAGLGGAFVFASKKNKEEEED